MNLIERFRQVDVNALSFKMNGLLVEVASDYVDVRKSINGLLSIILNEYKHGPNDNFVFVFSFQGRDKIRWQKIIN
ncbi:MAG: IS66 family insertion sequence element accessory protein TnpB [Bacilli bacterium]